MISSWLSILLGPTWISDPGFDPELSFAIGLDKVRDWRGEGPRAPVSHVNLIRPLTRQGGTRSRARRPSPLQKAQTPLGKSALQEFAQHRTTPPFHHSTISPSPNLVGTPSRQPALCIASHSSMKVLFHCSVRGFSIMSR